MYIQCVIRADGRRVIYAIARSARALLPPRVKRGIAVNFIRREPPRGIPARKLVPVARNRRRDNRAAALDALRGRVGQSAFARVQSDVKSYRDNVVAADFAAADVPPLGIKHGRFGYDVRIEIPRGAIRPIRIPAVERFARHARRGRLGYLPAFRHGLRRHGGAAVRYEHNRDFPVALLRTAVGFYPFGVQNGFAFDDVGIEVPRRLIRFVGVPTAKGQARFCRVGRARYLLPACHRLLRDGRAAVYVEHDCITRRFGRRLRGFSARGQKHAQRQNADEQNSNRRHTFFCVIFYHLVSPADI